MPTNNKPELPNLPGGDGEAESMIGRLIVNMVHETKERQQKPRLQPTNWIDKHFGAPRHPEDILWRFSWLFTVPAMSGLIFYPLMRWCWFNGLPIVPALIGAAIITMFALFNLFVKSANCRTPKPLVEVQTCIPMLTLLFILLWSVMNDD